MTSYGDWQSMKFRAQRLSYAEQLNCPHSFFLYFCYNTSFMFENIVYSKIVVASNGIQ